MSFLLGLFPGNNPDDPRADFAPETQADLQTRMHNYSPAEQQLMLCQELIKVANSEITAFEDLFKAARAHHDRIADSLNKKIKPFDQRLKRYELAHACHQHLLQVKEHMPNAIGFVHASLIAIVSAYQESGMDQQDNNLSFLKQSDVRQQLDDILNSLYNSSYDDLVNTTAETDTLGLKLTLMDVFAAPMVCDYEQFHRRCFANLSAFLKRERGSILNSIKDSPALTDEERKTKKAEFLAIEDKDRTYAITRGENYDTLLSNIAELIPPVVVDYIKHHGGRIDVFDRISGLPDLQHMMASSLKSVSDNIRSMMGLGGEETSLRSLQGKQNRLDKK